MLRKKVIVKELERIEKFIEDMKDEKYMKKCNVEGPYQEIGWYIGVLNNVKKDLELLKNEM